MTMNKTLVFPAGMPQSLAYAKQAERDGRAVVGASSLHHDPAKPHYDAWAFLPYVTDPDFVTSLQGVVQAHSVTSIYTPNAVVWEMLDAALPNALPNVSLVNSHPMRELEDTYKASNDFARSLSEAEVPLFVPTGRSLPPLAKLASIYHHLEAIPGMCDHDKTRALFAIFQSAPAGDVVEIGSWWGKSAFLLAQLAQMNGTGPVLCVDPWDMKNIVQNDAGGLVDAVDVDPAGAFQIFLVNLLPYAQGRLNYLRKASVDAAPVYAASRQIESPEFDAVTYSGEISVLHIDGNHSEAAVRADVEAWCSMVKPGGWIILDDYVWPYGDGPKVVGDAYLEKRQDEIATSFVMGSALFIKLTG
ncbi:class I SAM-dependent methyltransferase [Tateyamaria sp. syn59]|uniref:class I SAM-dependent methyltransferase n=1 Tax=Tateyamaria sp. syn59 TaxID=2576942 RepID=UPI0011BF3F03|nr:class I SAM-dependent methyltransferase [Tateyamaria sp. syn59]